MPFLTLEDPNAKIKGSRDPLGAQPVWGRFARHVVTNVTSAANSVRGYTILLLGRYYGSRLIAAGTIQPEDALSVVLRMEQLGAYARFVGHQVEGDIRGIERVKRYLDEYKGRPYIDTGGKGRILSDQRVYGLWGLFTVSARASGLLPEGEIGVAPGAAEFIDEVYRRPHLKGVEGELLRMLAKGGRLQTKANNALFKALCNALPERYEPREIEFYAHYLRDALECKTDPEAHGRQSRFARVLIEHTDLAGPLDRAEAVALAAEAEAIDAGLAERLRRIVCLESLLAPADALFDHLLTQDGQRPESIARRLSERWGGSVPNLDPVLFRELLGEIESASSTEQARAMSGCQSALASGQYVEAVEAVLAWNANVMKERGAAPWARRAGKDGVIEVRYRGAEQLLPGRDELGTLWRNQYFVDSLKRISRQLRNEA